MPDTLSYADAVRLLGGEKSKVVDWFDKLTGGALLAASVPVPVLLGIFDAKAEFVRLGHELVRGVSERRSGLSRYGRTQRLEAAHAVIAVTAFFEALAEADLPLDFAELELSMSEQVTLAGAGPTDARWVLHALFEIPTPLPVPELPYPKFRKTLDDYYVIVAGQVRSFVTGLALGDRLTSDQQRALRQALGRVPAAAVDRHRDLLTALAADFPEVRYWAGLHEHEATRAEVRHLAVGLTELREMVAALGSGGPPDAPWQALARAYRAELDRPIVSSGEVPDGLRVPTLGEAYVPPAYRVATLTERARPSDETWWAHCPSREDLAEFLTGHLTSPLAVRAPLLVLGQPGSGKSVLTRALAAQLPATDFLVVRVVLREVRLEADLQDQIEQAVRDATGEALDWPAMARSVGDALPVVMLDGFDELLQATGVTQTDYLLKVAAFQQRELDQGRPVAVLVTSRTSVADRAKSPARTVALRLEPFDPDRVALWVATWNATNADRFPALGVPPLAPAAVLVHPDLAGQPLLLLMLALYAADGNDLHAAGTLGRGELYERLLHSFARREVIKHRAGLSARELSRATEAELRRLTVVAFATFNRGVQWVTEEELESDLAGLPFLAGESPRLRSDGSFREPLRAAEIVLGRFFFVHRAQAARGGRRAESYEFLHATFGEYLVARTITLVLHDLAARDAASILRTAPLDDELHVLLSHAVLTGRAPIVGFLSEALQSCADADRDQMTEVVLRLFQQVHQARSRPDATSYQPRALSVPERHAVYSANLLVLGLSVAGELTGAQLFPAADDVPGSWRRQALLWRSQLTDGEYRSVVNAIRLERTGEGGHREIRLGLADESWWPADLDLAWTYGLPPSSGPGWRQVEPQPEIMRRMVNFECAVLGDAVQHALEPALDLCPPALGMLVVGADGPVRSVAQVLITMSLGSGGADPADRIDLYRVVGLMLVELRGTAQAYLDNLAVPLLDRLAADRAVPRPVAVELLGMLDFVAHRGDELGFAYLRACLAVIGENDPVTREVGRLVRKAVHGDQGAWSLRTEESAVEALVRLSELGAEQYYLSPEEADRLTALLGGRRPDLVHRIRPLVLDSSPLSPRGFPLPSGGAAD